MNMTRQLVAGLRLLVVMTLLLGLAYPLVVTGLAQVLVPGRADGSLVEVDGETVGSSLLGQLVDDEALFQPRPSAAGDGYDGLSSSASNLAATSPDLAALIEERRAEVAEREGVDPELVPDDALTASASGLDPHISPAYAALQVERVASENGLAAEDVRALVAASTTGRDLGFIGEPTVNVLELNIAVRETGE